MFGALFAQGEKAWQLCAVFHVAHLQYPMLRALAFGSVILTLTLSVKAEPPSLHWRQSASLVALLQGEAVLWQFNYGPDLNVPYFHPVSISDRVLTWDQPADHVWHHGVWFSWKYINDVNYWEHDRKTGKPFGCTEWSDVQIKTRDDHSANITMTLAYHPAGDDRVALTERRKIEITAPDPQGEFYFDWTAEFIAGDEAVELDRTPPKERSWGGYAGLSVRFAKELTERQATCPSGQVEFGPGDRHRSRSTAMDYSGIIDQQTVGMAMLDHPDNPRHPTPWYVIRSPVMGFFNAALLHDEPFQLQPGEPLTLRYRLIVHPQRFDAARLQAAQAKFWQSVSANPK